VGNHTTEKTPNSPREAVGHEASGDRIAKYTLLRVLGQGTFGVVWEALEDPPLARRVAIKILLSGFGPHAQARFEREGPILAALKHPGIAEVLDTGTTTHGHPYQVLELIEGQPLDRFASQLDESARLELLAKVCDAVAFANARGVIHRDLKPSNILVTVVDGVPIPKLIDFGIAKQLGAAPTDARGVTLRGQALGTLEYMSPEQAQGVINVDARSDVFALGVILCELITGKPPFVPVPGESDQQALLRLAAQNDIRSPRTIRRDVPRDLETIILRATDIAPARRYATAADIATDIRRFLQGEPITGSRDSAAYTTWRHTHRWMRRNTAMTGAIVVLLATLLGVFVYSPLLARHTRAHEFTSGLVFHAPAAIETPRSVRVIALDDITSPEDLAAVAALACRDPKLSAALGDVTFDDNGSLRLLHAEMLSRLARAQPRCVALDIFFRRPREREDPFLVDSLTQLAQAQIPAILAVREWPVNTEPPAIAPAILAVPGVRWGVVQTWPHAESISIEIARKNQQRRADTSLFLQAYAATQNPHAFADATIESESEGVRLTFWKYDDTAVRRDIGEELLIPVDSITQNEPGAPGSLIADWKLTPPVDLAALNDITWSYSRALKASPTELADWCRDHVVIIGDVRRTTPSGEIDYPMLDRPDLPGVYVVAQCIEQLLHGRPTRVPTSLEGPVILAAMASVGVFAGSIFCRRPLALALTLVALTVSVVVIAIIVARVFAYECGPLIPAVTLVTAGIFAALLLSRLQPLRLPPSDSLSRI